MITLCGRFTLIATPEEIAERFHVDLSFFDQYEKSYNIAPSQKVFAIINDGKKNRAGLLRWGLIPPWAKDEKIGFKMINARSETLAEKPSFRHAFKKQRCLIIADSFYEWKKVGDTKQPMRISLKDGRLFAMAGLWERWQAPTDEMIYTCTIVTTKANPLIEHIHERMPVILEKEDEQLWLDRNNQDVHLLQSLLKPYSENEMETYPVSHLVNSAKNNSPECIQPLSS